MRKTIQSVALAVSFGGVALSGCADSPSPSGDGVGVYGNCAAGDVACSAGGQASSSPEVSDPGTGGNATAGANNEAPPDIVGIGVVGAGGAAAEPAGAGGNGGTDATTPPLVGCDVGVADPNNPPQALTLSGNLGAHDPVIIAAHDQYYYFSTGGGVAAKVSPDLLAWSNQPAVFATIPAWFQQQVPDYQPRNTWAPDISYFGGQYHLYYSVSSFGSNRSCIGHATRPALNAGNWTDLEDVFCSVQSDDYNAIDPNVILDEAGTPWMSFGSFWDGIKMIQLDQNGDRAGTELYDLASRNGGSIEAPFIVQRCGYHYLFVSFGACCDGVDSTYNIRVGRSPDLLGPYVARDGTPMLNGGGTLLLEEGGDWVGPGHNAILFDGTRAYNVYHAYAATNGASQLRISELVWDSEGWPVSGGP